MNGVRREEIILKMQLAVVKINRQKSIRTMLYAWFYTENYETFSNDIIKTSKYRKVDNIYCLEFFVPEIHQTFLNGFIYTMWLKSDF